MLSIGQMGSGQGSYYQGLAHQRYFQEGGEPLGQWWGQGAARLGLAGQVETDPFLRTFEGFHPFTDERLVQNAGKQGRLCGLDLTFSAPKSVSTVWAVSDREEQGAIQRDHAAAVQAALGYLEDECAFTRRGQKGQQSDPAGLVVAVYEHGTSRAQDPQLHSHALCFNAGLREDGTFGALHTGKLFHAKMAAGALYRAELSRRLELRGYAVERTANTFEIRGVPASLVEAFSQRRAEIKRALAERGLSSARAAAVAALDTRSVKEHIAREQLVVQWRQAASEHHFGVAAAAALRRSGLLRSPRQIRAEMQAAVAEAKNRLSHSASHFSRRDLLRGVAEAAQGRGLGAEHARVAVDHELQHGDLVHLGSNRGEARYTTKELFQLEMQLLAGIEALQRSEGRGAPDRALTRAVAQVEAAETRKARELNPAAAERRLTPEQHRALRHITQRPGRVSAVTGIAGSGKSFLFAAGREVWESEGYRVLGVALSGKAARGLQEGAGIQSYTVARLLQDLSGGTAHVLADAKHHLRQLGRAALGKKTFDRSRLQLDGRTVLVVDEAGMVGTRQMAELVAGCERAGCRLVLAGDARQLQAVEVGGPFRSITARIGQAELTQIVRQQLDRSDRNPLWRRQAVAAFADGRATEALAEFQQRGLLHVQDTREGAMRALVETWAAGGTSQPQEHLILAATREETRELNRLAQAARRSAGKLGHRQLRVEGQTLFERDRVLFTRNSYGLDVRNGDLGTIREIDLRGQRLTVRLDSGRDVTFSLQEYADLLLGYAATTHKAQGATVSRAYVLAGNAAMTDRELTYVQASRARENTQFFTHRVREWDAAERRMTDVTLDELGRQMSRSRVKDLAHDVLCRENPAPARGDRPELLPTL